MKNPLFTSEGFYLSFGGTSPPDLPRSLGKEDWFPLLKGGDDKSPPNL